MSDSWVIEASPQSLARIDNELRGYLRNRGRPTDEIESVMSRTWIAAGRTFQGRCSLRNFLYAVMRRTIMDYQRTAKRRPWYASQREENTEPDDLLDDTLEVYKEFDDRATAERVRAALAKIPPHYAEVVELVLKGYGHLAIADKLGLEYNTVRSRYSRGKAHLLELLRLDDE